MTKVDNKYLLALNAHPQIGSQTLKRILSAFPDCGEIWSVSDSAIRNRLGNKIAGLVMAAKKSYHPDEIIERLKKYDIGYITNYDKTFPSLLAEICDAPVVLYIKGNIKVFERLSIAVVGSRKYTNYGQRMTRMITIDCVKAGLAIVSGLALGIDGIAHQTALNAGGITIAVLGCGLDRIYPASHSKLAQEILERDGAIISEYPTGTPTLKQNFPLRNRIIAGLTLGTLVIEAGEDSGSLITAECALDYNREVFAVPGNIDSDSSKGTNQLIQKGAKLVMTIDDILSELPIKVKKSQIKAKEIMPENREEQVILDLLAQGEGSIDYIIAESKLNVVAVNSALTMMEMKGMIENIGGGRYRKIC